MGLGSWRLARIYAVSGCIWQTSFLLSKILGLRALLGFHGIRPQDLWFMVHGIEFRVAALCSVSCADGQSEATGRARWSLRRPLLPPPSANGIFHLQIRQVFAASRY